MSKQMYLVKDTDSGFYENGDCDFRPLSKAKLFTAQELQDHLNSRYSGAFFGSVKDWYESDDEDGADRTVNVFEVEVEEKKQMSVANFIEKQGV